MFWKKISFLNNLYIKYKWRQRRIKLGNENKDKIFFVIRRSTCYVGLFSYITTNIGLVRSAIEKGFIPVIDMQNNLNSYLEPEQIGKKNAWEFYFEQPCGYTLEDIKHSRNIILSCGIVHENDIYPGKEVGWEEDICKEWREFCSKYLKVKTDIKEEAKRIYNSMFGEEKTLGVLARGTDYIYGHPHNHPVQPEVDSLILKVRETKSQYSCRWIYLATEDEKIYQRFKEEFGDCLKVSAAKRLTDGQSLNINKVSFERENDRFLRGKEYLINILLLSMCQCLVGGNVGGTVGALLLSKGYEYQYVFNLGLYE